MPWLVSAGVRELLFFGELHRGGHGNHALTCELRKHNNSYCRSSKYNAASHPRVRVTEAMLDAQVRELFDRLRIGDPVIRE